MLYARTLFTDSGISDYLSAYSTLLYGDYIKKALKNYFYTMSNGKLNLTVEILESSEPNGVWRLNNKTYYEIEIPKYQIRTAIISDLENAVSENPDYENILNQDDGADEEIFMNYILPDYDDQIGYIRGNNTETQLEAGVSFDKITRKLTQQLAQTLFAVGVKGYELTESHFDGYKSGDFMGRAGSQTGPYDLMFKWDIDYEISPYSLYGLNPIHSQDLMKQGYIDSDVIVAEESQLLEVGANSYTVRLNGIRNTVVKTQTKSKAKESLTGKLVKIPVTAREGDSDDSDSAFPKGSMTDNQYFLIEYKNPSGYDELSPYGFENQSTGVLISHIINGDGGENDEFASAVIDIESATPLSSYRNPSFTNTNDPTYNGTYYNGREVNDWLDDFNDNSYSLEGGKATADQIYGTCSLHSDFFNNTDRNKFTPMTFPSSDSWKLNDTHIGVFIDDINNDLNYADIRVYRNYWSKPIEADQIVNIDGIGYFGENFFIGSGAELTLGTFSDKPVTSSFSLIKESQMTLGSNSTLNLINDTRLILEEGSNLVFEEQSSITFSGTSRIKGGIETRNLALF
ncbi:MAG: hypothetical protein KKD38_01955, partial [Candidatus Delongbacteria bacterium]|nr:hypothetical protein [Candidatus Delongbacteria bacterium]